MSNVIFFSEHRDHFTKIQPLMREVCTTAGLSDDLAAEVIDEYKLYFEQLTSMSNEQQSSLALNHACHIILGLLVKARL